MLGVVVGVGGLLSVLDRIVWEGRDNFLSRLSETGYTLF